MSDLPKRLREACNGHPSAAIPWPHRLLHEAADALDRYLEREAMLTEVFESLFDLRTFEPCDDDDPRLVAARERADKVLSENRLLLARLSTEGK